LRDCTYGAPLGSTLGSHGGDTGARAASRATRLGVSRRPHELATRTPQASSARYGIDAAGYIVADGSRVTSEIGAEALPSGVARLFAVARIRLAVRDPDARVYHHAATEHDARKRASRNADGEARQRHTPAGFFICVTATRVAFASALLAEEACGATAAWVVDGALRHPAEDRAWAASFASCRHDGAVRRGAMAYERPVHLGDSHNRAVSS
jgi:hypothetical protein